LDGFIVATGSIWEAKHTSAFGKPDEILERYMPQLQHNMAVAKADRAILSVIFGNHKFEMFEVASDWLYQLDLLQAEEDFWNCVVTGREPLPAPTPVSPKPIGTREICLEGNNAWASAAVDWVANRAAAKIHASACTIIKSLVEDDVSRAFGHGVEAKRSKAGAISIRELVQ
jgi:predicted phage-related endonuclease